MHRVLQPEIHTDLGGISIQHNIGAIYEHVGSEIVPDPRQCVRTKTAGVGHRKLDGHARHILSRYGAQFLSGCQFRREHLGKRRRKPRGIGLPRKILETQDGNRRSGFEPRRDRLVSHPEHPCQERHDQKENHTDRQCEMLPSRHSHGPGGDFTGERFNDIVNVAETGGSLTIETSQNGCFPNGVEFGNVCAGRRRWFVQPLQYVGEARLRGKWKRSTDDLVHHNSERVNVRCGRDFAILQLLRCHVRRCPHDIAGMR